MAKPNTLRKLAGLEDNPASLSESTLLMIDCQNTYRTGVMQLSGVEAALDEASRLLAPARQLRAPVIHIQHDSGPGSPYDIRAEIGAIADKAMPVRGIEIIHVESAVFTS